MSALKITLIGVGSTIFVKNIPGNVLHREVLRMAHVALMDINPTRLEESHIVVRKLVDSAGASDRVTCHTQQREALQDADFVAVAFQTGDYEPCTVTDFEVCKRHSLEQTIIDTLEPGGIVRALRTIPHLWRICEDMMEVCLGATTLNYVNPMTMNTWAMYACYSHIKQIGLCHSVQGMAEGLARDLGIDPATLRCRCAGINHMAFYPELERKTADGSYVNPYPELLTACGAGQTPRSNIHDNIRCQNIVRCEVFKKLGYFVAESSEYFAKYTPWFIKPGREDLIERYKVPPDEYPKRCVEQLADWHKELGEYKNAFRIDIRPSREHVSAIMNTIWTDEPSVIYGDVRNDGLIDDLS